MKLYHGTTGRVADKVLEHGLQPRGRRVGNWKHSIASNPDAVYLTIAYPTHYAICAARRYGQELAVIEIDSDLLNPFSLAPDEDAIEQTGRKKDGIAGDYKARTAHFRDRLHTYSGGENWQASLNALGNCTYFGTIKKPAITRILRFTLTENPFLRFHLDPQILLLNFRLLGKWYINAAKALFGDAEAYAALNEYHDGIDLEGKSKRVQVRKQFPFKGTMQDAKTGATAPVILEPIREAA